MDEATQQNTQPVFHLRTKGANSMLKTRDEADILCVFHPASPPAHKAVELVLETGPQHILRSLAKGHVSNQNLDGAIDDQSQGSETDRSERASPDPRAASLDIALRMSSQVRDRRMGFVFGRNLNKCDLLMARDSKRLSNAHFRVYVNHSGVLMLEDMSINGTYVDHNLLKSLKADPSNHALPSTRMLSQGSIIELPVIAEKNEEWIRFIVLFPTRKNGEEAYQANLVDYVQWIKQDERKVQIARAVGGLLPPARPMPFTPLQKAAKDQSPPTSTIAAATGQNNYGMKWNGGETYNVVGYIGQGAFAMVYKLSTVQHGEVYACKQIEKRRFVKDGQPGHKMHHEIRIMESISHPNIVQFVDFHETNLYMFIVMEYVPLGDLTLYTNEHMMMYEHMGQHVAAQICQALKYLHEQKIAHRDIKPDNILIASHNPFEFKLSDFGLSKVVSSEDNMRTFCGTILYCAPEIYPGYERAKAGMPLGKRGRHLQLPREETQPYYYSVDTWGIAAVLFHLLSGQPAWAGTTDDNGAVMLETIFSIPIDWERLTLAGLSDLAVDFVKQMLQIDPADRATDDEVLEHPWIRKIVSGKRAELHRKDDLGTGHDYDDEDLPDASQLEITDKSGPYGSDGTNKDDLNKILEDKNKITGEHEQLRLQNTAPQAPRTVVPNLQPQDARILHPANNRLFGEIPESALQSSGLLGQNVNQALDIGDSEMEEYEDDEENLRIRRLQEDQNSDDDHQQAAPHSSFRNGPEFDAMEGNVDEQRYLASVENLDDHQVPNLTSASDPDAIRTPEEMDITPQNIDFQIEDYLEDLEDSSPYDTEDSIEDSDMAPSRHSAMGPPTQVSKAVSTQTNASGKKAAARQYKRSSQHLESVAHDASIKRSKTDHQASSERQLSSRISKGTPPTRASRRLKKKQTVDDAEPHRGTPNAAKTSQGGREGEQLDEGDVQDSKWEGSSFEMHEVSKTVTPYRIRDDPDELYLAICASEKWKKANPERVHPGKAELYKAMTARRYHGPPPIAANSGPNLNTIESTYGNLRPYDLNTPTTLGVLTPTEGSIPTVDAITVTNRTTTFGRDPTKNTFVHPGDTTTDNWERVGKNCIDLTFWYRNIEKEIDDKALPSDWYNNPDLVCLISTRTTRYILINGVKLTKAYRGWDYGKLRTGDIITVVEPDLDREPRNESETKSLSFRCEFYTGLSKDPRPADGSEPFEILTEADEFDKNQQRICKGFAQMSYAMNREKLIAEGRDPDAERAERAEKRRVIREEIRAKEIEEHAGHVKRMRERGLIGPDEEVPEEIVERAEADPYNPNQIPFL